MSKRKSKFKILVSVIVVLLVLGLAIWLISKYTDLPSSSFSVEYNGVKYRDKFNVIEIPKNGQARFTVKGCDTYKVNVVPNVTRESDFDYIAGNTFYRYSEADIERLFLDTNSFDDNGFILRKLDCTLENVLSVLHAGENIVLKGAVRYPFALKVTAKDKTITFVFGSTSFEPTITLNPRQIEF